MLVSLLHILIFLDWSESLQSRRQVLSDFVCYTPKAPVPAPFLLIVFWLLQEVPAWVFRVHVCVAI